MPPETPDIEIVLVSTCTEICVWTGYMARLEISRILLISFPGLQGPLLNTDGLIAPLGAPRTLQDDRLYFYI